MIKDVNHIGINVCDMEASINFYGKVLGFEKLGGIVDQKDLKCRVQYMKAPDGVMIEFIEYYPDVEITTYKVTQAGVYRHIAFTVESKADYDFYLNKLNEAKNKFPNIVVPEKPEYLPYLDLDVLLFHDPNGVEIELCLKRSVGRYDWPQDLVK